ncbi:hypothetical protein HID58_009715, partial [Brassica napus]
SQISMSNMVKWSELNADVLQSILERLSIINYLKARSVCKNWRVVCKQISSIQDKFPWIIIFPRRRPKSSTCQVFNPQEGKLYTLRNLGNDFSTHQCIATSGSWLLMLDLRSNLYVLNVFTRERIDLPPLESHQGRLQVNRLQNNTFTFMINQSSAPGRNVLNRTKAVLWVDEKTKGYLVVWSIGLSYIMYTKNGIDFWREIPIKEGPENLHGCQDIVYKDNNLYILTGLNRIRILDCSQELPRALVDNVDDDPFRDDQRRRGKIGVTVSGEVLIVKNRLKQVFNILKMNSDGTSWDEVESLGEESWITDLGVTVPGVDGSRPNSIYYRDRSLYCGDLSVQVLEMILEVDKNGHARWFIPSLRELFSKTTVLLRRRQCLELGMVGPNFAPIFCDRSSKAYTLKIFIGQELSAQAGTLSPQHVRDKGDATWRNHKGARCRSMAYKDNKLYVYTSDGYIKILDLSGDSVREIVEGNPCPNHRFQFVSQLGEHVWRTKVAVTNSGEVLIFGHGVTVRSPIKEIDGQGIKSDSICFIDYDLWPGADYFYHTRQIKSGIFDLATRTITWPKTSDPSVLKSFWFVPGYA